MKTDPSIKQKTITKAASESKFPGSLVDCTIDTVTPVPEVTATKPRLKNSATYKLCILQESDNCTEF